MQATPSITSLLRPSTILYVSSYTIQHWMFIFHLQISKNIIYTLCLKKHAAWPCSRILNKHALLSVSHIGWQQS